MASTCAPRYGLVGQIAGIVEDHPDEPLTLAGLFVRLGGCGAGWAIFLLSLPAFASGIPFVSSIFGIPLALAGAQMMAGRPMAFPGFMASRPLPRAGLRHTLNAVSRRLGPLERGMRERWAFARGPLAERWIGLVVVALGIMIAIPLPLTNMPPAIGAAIIGLGLAGRDGLVVVTGVGVSLLALVFSSSAVVASGVIVSALLRG